MQEPIVWTWTKSPLGRLRLVGRDGALSGLYFEKHRGAPAPEAHWREDLEPFAAVVAQLGEFFSGRRTAFDLDLELDGTGFQQRVWSALREIPYGAQVTYGELAARIGAPRAARAVGRANALNPISIIVPCHRVVASNGSLTGYAGGIAQKSWLLDLERSGPAMTRRGGGELSSSPEV